MIVVVKLFAGARQLAEQDQIKVELPPSANIGELRESLASACPKLGPLLPHAFFAIDTNYALDETLVPEGAEVACIPPVSGG